MTNIDQSTSNPLLLQNPIEEVDQISPAHVTSAISSIVNRNKQDIETLINEMNQDLSLLNWESFMTSLETLDDRLSKAWSPVSHLNSVCNTDELRAAYDKGLAILTEYSTQLGQNKGLFELTESLYESAQIQKPDQTRQHILKDALVGFKLSGLHLDTTKQAQFAKIQNRLAELSSKYQQNLMDATMAWTKHFEDEAALQGLPDTELSMLGENAKIRKQSGFVVTLEIPSYLAIMTYADDRELREEVYRAYSTRASDQSQPAGTKDNLFDNTPVMVELLKLKQSKAKLLGFENYAQLSLESKMAGSPEEVIEFLTQLNQASKKQAASEFNSLNEFVKALENDDIGDLKAWDVAYYSEKLKQQQYQISQSELRPYFTVDKVLRGLFELTENLYDVSFERINDSAVWHEDVMHYKILRNQQPLAEFYLDLYARQHKRGGAWMDSYQSRFKKSNQQIQIPIAYLTCNFAPPINNQPALLTHDEVVTLFHEFGHGLHHMLTKVDELSASGISNVPWDAVELPSQFMENFCYQPAVIKTISSHVDTGEALPKELLEKLIAAKNFQSAMTMVRQLEFALFDMRIHNTSPLSSREIQAVLDETRKEVAVIAPPKSNRFQNGFSHIFAGGYSAGYYSYKWAEVLSADAFSLFEEKGILDKPTGVNFLTNILEKGGSDDPMDLFEAFRGRKPKVDALLAHSGIQQ